MNRGYFQKFQIKDVVFLAIMSAVHWPPAR